MAHFSPDEMARRLKEGLLAFPITPFDRHLALNRSAFRDHLAWMIPLGAAGLFAPGGTGEFFSLTPTEVGIVLRDAVSETNGRVPVLSGVGYGRAMAIEMARDVEAGGADGILLLPPYLVGASQDGLAAHVEAVCNTTSLGVIVYNRDNAILQADTLAWLCDRCPNLVGVKDGVGDLELAVRIESKLGDRVIYVGGLPTAETFAMPYLTIADMTYSSALFNFLPDFAVRFFRAVREHDTPRVKRLLRDFVLPYTAIRDRGRGYAVSIVKAGANLVGRNAGPVRPPLTDLDDKSLAELEVLISGIRSSGALN